MSRVIWRPSKRAWAACGQRPRAVIDCVGGDPLPTEGGAPRGRSNTPPRAWCARRQRKQSRTPRWQVAPCFASCARHACGRRRRAGAGAGGHACGDTYAPQALPRAQGPRGGGTSHQINSPGVRLAKPPCRRPWPERRDSRGGPARLPRLTDGSHHPSVISTSPPRTPSRLPSAPSSAPL